MIVNVVDSRIFAPRRQPGIGSVTVKWQVGSQISGALPPNIGIGAIQLLRIIAPHQDLARLADLLKRALPSIRRYFAPSGWIEIYGQRVSNTIGGSLAADALNTIGGTLRRDAMNTIGGTLRRDAMNTIGGTLRGDAMNTIGGSLGPDRSNTIGGSLAPDLVRAVMGAQCLYLRP